MIERLRGERLTPLEYLLLARSRRIELSISKFAHLSRELASKNRRERFREKEIARLR
jgi:hypothetical protein